MDSEERQSSIVVAVRVRPFTEFEASRLIDEGREEFYVNTGDSNLVLPGANAAQTHTSASSGTGSERTTRPPAMLRPRGVRKIVECVDDKMLLFDPAETNPLNKMSETVLNSMYSGKALSRRRLRRNGGEVRFVFDRLFDVDATQRAVYESTITPLLDSVLDGFNGTVFAYGATGCGKTYTISGSPENPGLIFLAMQELFARIEELKDTKNFELSLSFLEIYNESIRDLLCPETSSKKLVILEDSQEGIRVAHLSHHHPQTVEDVMDLVIRGNMNRTTSATDANETSSRSHAVLQIHIMQRNRTADLKSDHTFATLSIIDLAGSERAATTKNRGDRLYEGANINRSLLALGNCINALCVSDGTRRTCHIPYRDSKLTRLLKFSLGGNCKTVMIVCISPSSTHYDETLNTLKYANRAKEIKTKVSRNNQTLDRHVGSYLKMISQQRQEIEELRRREQVVVDMRLTKYRLSREKVQLAIDDCVQSVRAAYSRAGSFHNAKNLKSLMLCKRRFLQLVQLEVMSVISLAQEWTDPHIYQSSTMLHDQLATKIRELEEKFDEPGELELVLDRCRTIDLPKLRELEAWDESRDLPYLEVQLDHIAELVRNEILVSASSMVERLLHDQVLSPRFKFLSLTLAQETDIRAAVQDLVKLDEEFENFGRAFLTSSSGGSDDDSQTSSPPATAPISHSILKQSRRSGPQRITKTTDPLGSGSPTGGGNHSKTLQTPKTVRWLNLDSPSTTAEPGDMDVSMQDIEPGKSQQSPPSNAPGRTGLRNSLLDRRLVTNNGGNA